MSWRPVEPSPFRGWIRWAPKAWPAADRPYFDLTTHRIVWSSEGSDEELPLSLPETPGLAYLPPPPASASAPAAALASRLAAGGSPVARHLISAGTENVAVAAAWVDPLAAWLGGDEAASWSSPLAAAPGGWNVVLPLIPGLTPEGAALDPWLDALAPCAPSSVVGVTAELTPADRRKLVDLRGENAFDAVFHGRAASEREVARRVAERGLAPLPAPPPPSGLSPRAERNRTVASTLWETAELELRTGAAEAESAALFAAARHIEASPLDFRALAREGNLTVLGWLSPAAREVLEDLLVEGSSRRLSELRRRWSGEDGR